MGNYFGIVSDDEIIRLSLWFPFSIKDQLTQKAQQLPIYKDYFVNGSPDNICLLFEDSITEFLERDPQIFQEFRQKSLEHYKNIKWEIHLSGSEIENNQKIQQKILQIMGTKQIQFKHTKIIHSISHALDYLFTKSDMLYNFKHTLDIITLNTLNSEPDYEIQFAQPNQIEYPYLLINLRGGVSFYQVEKDNKIHRIQGSIVGESMIEGLQLLIDNDNPEKDINKIIIEAFRKGDHRKVDMTVEDIYGSDTGQLGLHKDLLASSFGKVAKQGKKLNFSQYDVIRSLIQTLCINVSLLTYLTAQLIPDIKQAVFVFWKLDSDILNYLIHCFVNYYSKNTLKPYFVKKSHYLSSLGVTKI